jgi:hypothetical protein
MPVGYQVDRRTGEVTFHTPITSEWEREEQQRIAADAHRQRPMNRGDAADILAALGRIEGLLGKLLKDAE